MRDTLVIIQLLKQGISKNSIYKGLTVLSEARSYVLSKFWKFCFELILVFVIQTAF